MTSDLNLGRLADPATLKAVWRKSLRRLVRQSRISSGFAVRDPLYWVQYEWNLDDVIGDLAGKLQAGEYEAGLPRVIRSAKGLGLTRPLSFPTFADMVVYRTAVLLGENEMIRNSPEWARMGRRSSGDPDDIFAESGWFRGWLRRQGQLWVIAGAHEWLVETDISNFFPSIDGTAAVGLVRSRTNLPDDACRVLGQILEAFAPAVEYRKSVITGLLQEPSDASRVLAHAIVEPVDRAFEAEGRQDRYSRWVDDIVVGADSVFEAHEIVGRIQMAMEKLGLYPNRSKTRVYRSAAFVSDYMKAENDYLGEVEGQRKVGDPTAVKGYRDRLGRHITVKSDQRPKAWERVLRRYYTQSRRFEDDLLTRWFDRHLVEVPTSAASVLDYMATFRLTLSRIGRLRTALGQIPINYEDVRILALEYLAQAPNTNSAAVWKGAADLALELFASELVNERWFVAASAAVVVGKYGSGRHIDALEAAILSNPGVNDPARLQALVVLVGAGRLRAADLERIGMESDGSQNRATTFLHALCTGETNAVGLSIGLIEPAGRRDPDRQFTRPRGLFLAPVIRVVAPKRAATTLDRWLPRLASNGPRHRDAAAERWLAATIAP